MTRPLFLALSLLLPACAGVERAERSSFVRDDTGAFEMRAATSLFYSPRADGWAEAQRLEWLGDTLTLGGYCPQGYVLLSRAFLPRGVDPYGKPAGTVAYRGRCVENPDITGR